MSMFAGMGAGLAAAAPLIEESERNRIAKRKMLDDLLTAELNRRIAAQKEGREYQRFNYEKPVLARDARINEPGGLLDQQAKITLDTSKLGLDEKEYTFEETKARRPSRDLTQTVTDSLNKIKGSPESLQMQQLELLQQDPKSKADRSRIEAQNAQDYASADKLRRPEVDPMDKLMKLHEFKLEEEKKKEVFNVEKEISSLEMERVKLMAKDGNMVKNMGLRLLQLKGGAKNKVTPAMEEQVKREFSEANPALAAIQAKIDEKKMHLWSLKNPNASAKETGAAFGTPTKQGMSPDNLMQTILDFVQGKGNPAAAAPAAAPVAPAMTPDMEGIPNPPQQANPMFKNPVEWLDQFLVDLQRNQKANARRYGTVRNPNPTFGGQ